MRARKKSLPVVAALTAETPAAAELAAVLRREDPLGEDDLAVAGGRDFFGGARDVVRGDELAFLDIDDAAGAAGGE